MAVYNCNHFLFLFVKNENYNKDIEPFLVFVCLTLAVHSDVSKGQLFY